MEHRGKIILLDGNAPWVRSLFSPLSGQFDIYAFRTQTVSWGTIGAAGRMFRWERQADGIFDKTLIVPGWTRFFTVSTALACHAFGRLLGQLGKVDLIVYTLPWYAGVAEKFHAGRTQVYHAFDSYRFYDWDPDRTRSLETRMLNACDAASVIAGAMLPDFAELSATPAFYCPNAVSRSFIEKMRTPLPVPDDVKNIKRPIIGCTGQINRSYDWEIIAAMADALPESSFVFIGPVFHEPPEVLAEINATLSLPNVKALGAKPHGDLPAYLQAMDVCFNPLRVNEHNDRRSPLRLYDYLATAKPVISTAVREAFSHEGLIATFTTADEGIELLREIAEGHRSFDLDARRGYIARNTWEDRARYFMAEVDRLGKRGG